MKPMRIAMVILFTLIWGCAYISEQAKQDEYDRTMYAYQTAMQLSDFNAICQYVDPEVMSRKECVSRFGAVKIVDFALTGMTISDDRQQVHQEIEVEFHPLNNIVLRKIAYSQSWAYQDERKRWTLQSGPPHFK